MRTLEANFEIGDIVTFDETPGRWFRVTAGEGEDIQFVRISPQEARQVLRRESFSKRLGSLCAAEIRKFSKQ